MKAELNPSTKTTKWDIVALSHGHGFLFLYNYYVFEEKPYLLNKHHSIQWFLFHKNGTMWYNKRIGNIFC